MKREDRPSFVLTKQQLEICASLQKEIITLLADKCSLYDKCSLLSYREQEFQTASVALAMIVDNIMTSFGVKKTEKFLIAFSDLVLQMREMFPNKDEFVIFKNGKKTNEGLLN